MNVRYPKNLETFFGYASFANLDFVPNPIESIVMDIEPLQVDLGEIED